MVLLGLSILVASLSFLCYRHPPASWSFLEWLRRPSLQEVAKEQDGISPGSPIPKLEEPIADNNDLKVSKDAPPVSNEKAAIDRIAMPPPPPPFKKPTPRYPYHAKTQPVPPAPPIPTFTLGNDGEADDEEPVAPSFPAANSAQRASGGVRGPPRLSVQPSSNLLALPSRSPLPNREPAGGTTSLLPPASHTSIPSKPRRKVLLEPGHSPLDWARLSSSPTANLRGLPANAPYIKVPPSLLKQYTGRKGKDAWTVLGGKVYNITPYASYHPGGSPELMKAAGRDGTRLFGEVHPWVNWEGMLENCLIGVAVEEGEKPAQALDEMD